VGFEVLMIVVSLIFAGIAGFNLMKVILNVLKRSERSSAVLGGNQKDRVYLKAVSVSRPLSPLAKKLMQFESVKFVTNNLGIVFSGLPSNSLPVANLSIFIGACLVVGVLVGVLGGSLVLGIACVGCIFLATFLIIKNKLDQANVEMREQVPEALRSIGSCYGSGYSLLQTMRNTGEEIGGNLGKVFLTCAKRLEMGQNAKEALEVMTSFKKVPELVFVAVALDVQHKCGGSISAVLESARDSVESELELMRNLKVQTSQAKLSASIVTLMPFILVALFSFISPGFLDPFFTSFAGVVLLVIAIVMQAGGVLIVRQMLRVDTM
jgi:tight adherence protein B